MISQPRVLETLALPIALLPNIKWTPFDARKAHKMKYLLLYPIELPLLLKQMGIEPMTYKHHIIKKIAVSALLNE